MILPSAGAMPALRALREVAATIEGIDVDCYARHGRDPATPIIGLGKPEARWCFFGRDPGEQEVREQTPFIGQAGRKIRAVMAEQGVHDDDVYWMNTVPFKPIGNQAWSMAVRRRCRPPLLELLARWNGATVVTFGEAAFKWFGLGSADDRRAIDTFWAREDRFEARLAMTLKLGGRERQLVLCPVPHPSGANAVWASRFPGLLAARLRASPGG
jgi:uracil-DNA glycosylase family 4